MIQPTTTMNMISFFKQVAVAAVLFGSVLPGFSQVSRTLGTLPPGGTVTITFDVVLDAPFPPNTGSVTNQGIFSGTGFGPVLTDDPATPLPNDPTITAVSIAPQITCPADITHTGESPCSPSFVAFAATVTAGMPAPAITYFLNGAEITSPYTFPAGTNLVTAVAANGTPPDATCSFKVIAVPGAPYLRVLRTGTQIVLSWPVAFNCYTLQFTPSLSAATWTIIPGPFPVQNGYLWSTNNLTGTNQFFRLKY